MYSNVNTPWATHKYCNNVGVLRIQDDGNLVVYDKYGVVVWDRICVNAKSDPFNLDFMKNGINIFTQNGRKLSQTGVYIFGLVLLLAITCICWIVYGIKKKSNSGLK